MPSIDETLAERGNRYGEFINHAEVTQNIKAAMADSQNWSELPDDMRECMEMVAHKIGRILNGDPNYVDSWTDIIGYVRLVEKRLLTEPEDPECVVCTTRRVWTHSKPEPTDKEIADKMRGLKPGLHYIFVDEESSTPD